MGVRYVGVRYVRACREPGLGLFEGAATRPEQHQRAASEEGQAPWRYQNSARESAMGRNGQLGREQRRPNSPKCSAGPEPFYPRILRPSLSTSCETHALKFAVLSPPD